MLHGKSHIRFSDFYFSDYLDSSAQVSGIFVLYNSNDIVIERCFYNGNTVAYAPSFVMASQSRGLQVRNCAILSVFSGSVSLVRCPEALIENNVFMRCRILHLTMVNSPDEIVRLRNNIITDNQPTKLGVSLLELSSVKALQEENNCYFMRLPPEERKLAMIYDPVAYGRTVTGFGLRPVEDSELPEKLVQIPLPEFQRLSGNSTSIAANPQFKGALEMDQVGKDGKPRFMADWLLNLTCYAMRRTGPEEELSCQDGLLRWSRPGLRHSPRSRIPPSTCERTSCPWGLRPVTRQATG